MYPFKPAQYRTYSYTFLGTVKLSFLYNCKQWDYKAFNNFFNSFFSLDLPEKQFNLMIVDALRIRSEDNGLRFKFTKNIVEFIIEGDKYRDFSSSLLPFIDEFRKYLTNIKSRISNLTIEKINLWSTPEDCKQEEVLLKTIFSNEFLENANMEIPPLKMKEFRDEGTSDSLVIKYGVLEEDNKSSVVLDSVISNGNDSISPEDLIPYVERMNTVLYNEYHWAVNQNVIDAMSKA